MKNKFIYTGESIIQGIKIAQEKHAKGKDIDFVILKTDQKLKDIIAQTNKAIEEHHPVAIIGGITSNSALVISEIAEEKKIPFITPYATNPKITENKSYSFRVCIDDQQQANALAKFAKADLKKKKALIFVDQESSYSLGLGQMFQKAFDSVNSTSQVVSLNNIYSIKDIDVKKTIDTFQPDLIFIPHYQMEAVSTISYLSKFVGTNVAYLGGDGWAGGQIFKDLIAIKKLNLTAYYVQFYNPASKNSNNQHFSKEFSKYQSEKNKEYFFPTAAALGHDSALLLLNSWNNKNKSLKDSLLNTQLSGATGLIRFENSGTPNKEVFIYKIDSSGDEFYKTVQ